MKSKKIAAETLTECDEEDDHAKSDEQLDVTKSISLVPSTENNGVLEKRQGEGIEIVIPPNIATVSSVCTLLVQIDGSDAGRLDFEGMTGAIGRFGANENCVTLDLKGYQYSGPILPGPTAIILSVAKDGASARIESVTDEFLVLEKSRDTMAQLDAVVEGDLDDGYQYYEEDVNKKSGKDSGGGMDGERKQGSSNKLVSSKKNTPKKRKSTNAKRKR